jgi:UDP-N-acetylglucosamine diphosphorylase/glucosamine-1-phosphate N-acetyltransferase
MEKELNICVFEDEGYKNLLPLTFMRPSWALRCGMTVLLEKILRSFPKARFSVHLREHLIDSIKHGALSAFPMNKIQSTSCVLINGRLLSKEDLSKKLVFKEEDEILVSGNDVVAARLSGPKLEFLKKALAHPLSMVDFEPLRLDVRFTQISLPLITYPWDLVLQNEEQLKRDFTSLVKTGSVKGEIHPSAVIYAKESVHIEAKAEVMAHVVLDARNGPIYIGKEAHILPLTRIEGPCYIGEKTKILGGKIRRGSSIGPHCKVNGELEETIIHGYSNKQHDGFLGHSYICEWVNLGAGTTNSDLKNTYGKVKVWINGKEVDSNETFVGSFIGDHSKTGIGTLLNTGTVIGVAANVFGGGLPPKFVPSFSWGSSLGLSEHRLDDAIRTARIVMDRRSISMTSADEMLLRKVFEQTKAERAARLM